MLGHDPTCLLESLAIFALPIWGFPRSLGSAFAARLEELMLPQGDMEQKVPGMAGLFRCQKRTSRHRTTCTTTDILTARKVVQMVNGPMQFGQSNDAQGSSTSLSSTSSATLTLNNSNQLGDVLILNGGDTAIKAKADSTSENGIAIWVRGGRTGLKVLRQPRHEAIFQQFMVNRT
jgi:hypothetical protein